MLQTLLQDNNIKPNYYIVAVIQPDNKDLSTSYIHLCSRFWEYSEVPVFMGLMA